MAAFSQKGLEALNKAWVDNETKKYDAERRAGLAESQGDSFALAAAYQDYADADATGEDDAMALRPRSATRL